MPKKKHHDGLKNKKDDDGLNKFADGLKNKNGDDDGNNNFDDGLKNQICDDGQKNDENKSMMATKNQILAKIHKSPWSTRPITPFLVPYYMDLVNG
jgi:hypothetical protein